MAKMKVAQISGPAIGRGPENAERARKLGAMEYIDTKATNGAQALKKMGAIFRFGLPAFPRTRKIPCGFRR